MNYRYAIDRGRVTVISDAKPVDSNHAPCSSAARLPMVAQRELLVASRC